MWFIVNIYWPGFYDPMKYWLMADNIPEAVFESWPLFLYCIVLTIVTIANNRKELREEDTELGQDIYKSVMAGILEEVGFRNLFIFTAMGSVVVMNTITFGFVLWFWQVVELPVIDFLSLGYFHNVLYALPAVFIAGAINANVGFRDGHKYQGLFGLVNSWYIGLYLLSVMLTQGLVIAILVHMTYDLIVSVLKFTAQKIAK